MSIVVSGNGRLTCEGRSYRCALGRAGVTFDKREGDGATPIGTFPLRRVLFRADRLARPPTRLPAEPIAPDDGWCDDPSDLRHYNAQVRLPHPSRCERLWRGDGVYDVIVVLGHNDDPPVPGLGSAIFLHVARADYRPTEGCVALALTDLLDVLRRVDDATTLTVGS
ncbi:MAG TPA: L,D-transpeptidase family protein [Candidatus Cybelea sp.]|nr:L,D-transpeptidase family protein [Candidatus Cybelea sp.]